MHHLGDPMTLSGHASLAHYPAGLVFWSSPVYSHCVVMTRVWKTLPLLLLLLGG